MGAGEQLEHLWRNFRFEYIPEVALEFNRVPEVKDWGFVPNVLLIVVILAHT